MTLAKVTNQRERDKFIEKGEQTAVATAEKQTVPTDTFKNNPTGAVTRDDDGNPTIIDIVIGETTYRQTYVWTAGYLASWTAWVEV